MQKKIFFKGALIVLFASIITRILGFFFRVVLANNLGAQGMGIYQLIMSLYMLVVTFATSGVSFAVSRIVSENMATKNKKSTRVILKTSILWAFFLGSLVCLTMLFFKDEIAKTILRDSRTTNSIFYLAPSIPFMAVSACIKGYFYAKRKPFFPSAASILEQTIKIIFVIFLIQYFQKSSINKACAIVAIGMTLSETISCIFMASLYFKTKKQIATSTNNRNNKGIFKSILKNSIPIQTNNSFNAALKLVESILIIESLKIFTNGNSQAATSTYGIIKGMVLPLIMFPTSFLQSIITVLIPELSGATASGNKRAIRKACEKSLQLTIAMGIFVSAMFISFPDKIAAIFYKNLEVAQMLKSLSLLCPILYVQMICMGILNAIGEQISSMKYNILEGVLRILLIVLLVPKGGINAFLALMFITSGFSLVLYSLRLVKVTAFPICLSKILIKPIFAIITSCAICKLVSFNIEKVLPSWIFIGTFGFLIFAIYFILLFHLGCLNKPEKTIIKNYFKPK